MVKVYVDNYFYLLILYHVKFLLLLLLENVEMLINMDDMNVDDEYVFVVKLNLVLVVINHFLMMMMMLLKLIKIQVNKLIIELQMMTKVLLDQ